MISVFANTFYFRMGNSNDVVCFVYRRDEKTAADERAAESSLREETLRERLATASDETETLLSAGNGPLIHMWSWKAGNAKPAARLAGHAASVCALAVDDGCIVSADTAGRLRVRRQPIQRRLPVT